MNTTTVVQRHHEAVPEEEEGKGNEPDVQNMSTLGVLADENSGILVGEEFWCQTDGQGLVTFGSYLSFDILFFV